MPELRWTLLILGALFIGVLAVWEIRRKRHARGQDANAPAGRDGERVAPSIDDGDAVPRVAAPERSRGDARSLREPTLTFPDVHLDARGDRASVAKPPIVEIDEASLADLKIEPHTVVDEFSATDRHRASDEALGLVAPTIPAAPRAATAPTSPLPGTSSTGPRVAASAAPRAGTLPDMPDAPRSAADIPLDFNLDALPDPEPTTDSSARFAADSAPDYAAHSAKGFATDSARRFAPESATDFGADSSPGFASDSARSSSGASYGEPRMAAEAHGLSAAGSTDHDDSEVLGPAVVRTASASALSPDDFDIPEPIVEWPDESSRKIIALRLVSGTGERFQGRAVRQALAAEGFQIGKFEIFHKPGPDARAVLSAASLTKPGTFTLTTMDGQRYGGLSLFAVLPGPLSAVETFDELLLTARSLNDRLRGALQDERGEPLTPTRSASIRDNLASSSSTIHH
jgi:cell division protein ZipA